MKKLHQFIKAWQGITKISFGKKATNGTKGDSTQQISLGGNFYSKDSNSILILMNAEENEFLFI